MLLGLRAGGANTYAYACVLACCHATEFDFCIVSSFDAWLLSECEGEMHSQIACRNHMAGSETQMRMLMLWCPALRRDSAYRQSEAYGRMKKHMHALMLWCLVMRLDSGVCKFLPTDQDLKTCRLQTATRISIINATTMGNM